MPKNKDLKRLVRARMTKTDESYTTALAQLLRKGTRLAEPDYAELAGMSDEAVRAKTGRVWQQWVRELDADDAASMPHREIAKHVHDQFEVSGWWAQTVTVGYERIKGLREIGQRRSGSFDANKSKTFPVPISELYGAFSNTRTRDRWLPGVELTVRKATPEKSMRITWDDETSVQAYFTAKGEGKSQVAIQHGKLADKADVASRKQYWGERLVALGEILSPSEPRAGSPPRG